VVATLASGEDFFGAPDENRVELSVGRDLVLVPLQSGGPTAQPGGVKARRAASLASMKSWWCR
jgi:hypothetical protein